MIKEKIFFLFFFLASFITYSHCDIKINFSHNVEKKYNIPADYTLNVLNNYSYKEFIIKTMDKPAEGLHWNRYKKIFLNQKKISDGITYFNNHKNDILEIANKFNFPPEILVSIVGVESNYGKYNFSIKVIDALCTLAFHYKRRAQFFLNELEYFILYAYKNNLDPHTILGSYAGAIGLPQFMPSSIIKYGYDFDGDNVTDLTNSTKDVLASIANYLTKKGWENRMPVAIYVNPPEKVNISDILNKTYRVKILKSKNIRFSSPVEENLDCKIVGIDKDNNTYDYWATFKNYYVLKSYNPSNKYALAVYLLSEELKKHF